MHLSIHKAYLLIGLLCLISHLLFGQNQKLSDSLKKRFHSGVLIENELNILKSISEEETNSTTKIEYSDLLIEKASQDSLFAYIHSGYLQKGNAYNFMGDNVLALESYLKSLKYAVKNDDEIGIGALMISIADSYTSTEEYQTAYKYYNNGIRILNKFNDSMKIGTALLNLGDLFSVQGKYDSALVKTKDAEIIFRNIGSNIGWSYSLGNLGIIYAEQGKDSMALQNMNQAIIILEELEDYYPISVYLTYISDLYLKKQNWEYAFSYAERGLDLALQYNLKNEISSSYLQLSKLFELHGNPAESLNNYKQYILYRDSIINIENVQDRANLRTDFEVSQKQIEVDLLDQQKKNQQLISLVAGIGIVLILIIAIGLYRRNNFINKAKLLVENEKQKSDLLLLNILPEETAKELKDNGKVQAKKYESVSVLFTDFEGFTKYSENLSPEELVESVNYYYSKFDEIMEKYGLEKIKTVGDAYMAAGGLPFPSDDHALKLVMAAFEIVDFVKESKKFDPDNMTRFDIRIGINSGPVVAGVVGTKKFAYDIWGDTVNIASRMESNSEPGKINISDNTYQLIKEDFNCTYRGEIEAKNKGKMKMYFVDANQVKTI